MQGSGSILRTNNSRNAYQLVEDLTTEKHDKSATTQDKSGKCLTEEMLNRWTGENSDIYNCATDWDPTDTRWKKVKR